MTELEQLTRETLAKINAIGDYWIDKKLTIILDALTTAYALGRASVNTPARVAAARANGAKNTGMKSTGRPKGAGDKKPRKPGRWAHKTQETEMKP